ncbi:MAG TPA: hypothetical protein VNA57_11040 [Acidimicrobiales bacterium]|nr:hypothetical protein [Acidimicrobiales bacterium]
MPRRFGYSRWDGTQVGLEVDAEGVLAEVTDDVLYHGDLDAALRRLLQSGFRDNNGEQVAGLRELLERLRRQRAEELQRHLDHMAGVMEALSPEQVQQMKEMFTELNQLLEMRQAGQDTTEAFAAFMRRHGQFFPGNPATLDELLEQMAAQMESMQSVLDSMTPEQRARLQELSDRLLSDLDLRWQVDQLAHNLREALPRSDFEGSSELQGLEALGLFRAPGAMGRLSELDQLEQLLRSATSPGALAEVDLDRVAELLGDGAAASLDRLTRLTRLLQEAGLIDHREGRLELTPKGLRRIGRNALADLFSRLNRDQAGTHQVEASGTGHERAYETKPYEFGDPFALSIERTVRNAVQRSGRGTPVRLTPEDFEVERTEALTRTATVLLLDLSLSMPMRDNFLAAKRVAMALHSLISIQFPRDFLAIVGFSEVARTIDPRQLPEVSWDFTAGTNMHHAFMLSRRLLAHETGTKQILMITDGEPTAHIDARGEPFFSYPPVRETVDATLAEAMRCTRAGIRINTFMLDATDYLKAFVERLTDLNKGRAFFTTPETLGDYVLVDFLEHKRARRRADPGGN